jgi:hypothetical protein
LFYNEVNLKLRLYNNHAANLINGSTLIKYIKIKMKKHYTYNNININNDKV